MISRFRSVAITVAAAGCAQAAMAGDDKAAQLLIGTVPASAWTRPALLTAPPAASAKATISLAGFLPVLPSSYFGSAEGNSRLLFLSPLSPLRAALRVAAHDLAAQTLTAFDTVMAAPQSAIVPTVDDLDVTPNAAASSRRREVLLRQRRRSVLNERKDGVDRTTVAEATSSTADLSGLNGRVELLTLPSGVSAGQSSDSSLPGGAGLVRVSGYLTDDLKFAVTGLAAESAATTWRAGAEFEFNEGQRNTTEIGAVYGTRFNAASVPIGSEVDRRSVGAFRLVHAVKIFDTVSARAGGRFIDAPFLRSSRAIDPEFSLLVENPESRGVRSYVRFDVSGDTLFPGLEVVTGEGDVITLAEGLPMFSRNFEAQRTWSRGGTLGYRANNFRLEARLQDQTVSHALRVLPSTVAGAPFVGNVSRNRAEIGSVLVEKTFAGGQAQGGIEYGYGRFAADPNHADRVRDFHQLTTRFDAYLRRTGTGIAIFHRLHEGAAVSNYEGDAQPRMHAQRYLVELRQDVPYLPAMIGANMALLVSLRNVYYDDIDHRNVDEFAVAAPPRRITGGIRVKF